MAKEDSVTASLDVFPFLRPNLPIPSPPSIGRQVDRMGRAAIATALISFVSDDLTRGADLDAYNAAPPADWVTFQSNIQSHLAVYDGLDGQCGNQLLINESVSSIIAMHLWQTSSPMTAFLLILLKVVAGCILV